MLRVKSDGFFNLKSFTTNSLAKNAKASTSLGVIASNLICGLVNCVEFDAFDRILIFFSRYTLGGSSASGTLRYYHGYFLKEIRCQNSVNRIILYTNDKPLLKRTQ